MNRKLLGLGIGLLVAMIIVGSGPAMAQTLYWGGGTNDISNGTALPQTDAGLSGTWNGSTKNWATNSSGTAYTNFISGATINFDGLNTSAHALITVQGSFTISGIMANLELTPSYWPTYTMTATSPQVLTFAGTNVYINSIAFHDGAREMRFYPNVQLAGTATLNALGYGMIEIDSASDAYSGPVNVGNYGSGNGFWLNDGSMHSVPSFNVSTYELGPGRSAATPVLRVQNSSAGVVNRLADNAVISLNQGIFQYIGRGNNGAAISQETIGKITVNGFGMLNLSSINSGSSANPQLVLSDATAGLDQGTAGRGALVVSTSGGSPLTDIVVSNGLPIETLLPWIMTDNAQFMKLNASKVLVTVPSTTAPADITMWGPGNDYKVTGALNNTLAGDLSINSLGFIAAATLNNAANGTLTIASGGMALANSTVTIANGKLTSGTNQLYLMNGNLPWYNLTLNCELTGNMDVIQSGDSLLFFGGASNNTYTGTTYVSGANGLYLNKSGSAVAIPGDVVVENGSKLTCNGSMPLASSCNATLKKGSYLTINDAVTVSHAGVMTISGGRLLGGNVTTYRNTHVGTGIQFNGGWICHESGGNGIFSLETDVGYASTSDFQARWERYQSGIMPINLDGSNRTFNIAKSVTLAAGTPEMVVDLQIANGTGGAGSITKTGNGVLQFTTTNTYTGGTTVNNGTVQVSSITAPAQSGLKATVNNNGGNSYNVTFLDPIAHSFVIGQPISSAMLGTSSFIHKINNDNEINVTAGGNTTALATDIAVSAVARSGNLGTGAVVVTNTGTLLLDAGVVVSNTITAISGGALVVNGAIVGKTSVTNSGSLRGTGTLNGALDLSGGTLVANLLSDTTCDQLTVGLGSNVTLSASTSVTVTNIPTFTPRAGSTWTLLRCTGGGTISGALPAVGNGYSLQTAAGNTQLNLVFPRRALIMYIE